EMPYRPACYKITKDSKGHAVIESDLGEEKGKYCYRFGGPTCLAGDVIGDYSFDTPLKVGDKIAFVDMIHYTIVKNTTFNGVELPSLGVVENGKFKLLKQFGYTDFKERN
ncbi:MAG: carboxynorspermidine decarboxylase, partial [Helicobacter sp.]|nr:carboxynorspermidine decarboxylase [Helicobacter sp.]